jgi:phosphoglycerate kinase
MKNIDTYDFQNKKAIIRVDFNVPFNADFSIRDTTRIDAAIPTIQKVLMEGGAVILMSHLGRPKGVEEKFSLKHLLPYLRKVLNINISFAKDCVGMEAMDLARNLHPGEVLLLENLRFHSEEKKGDQAFAKKLADLADVYINDAFGTAHRAHASTAVIADYFPEDKMFGYIMTGEIESLEKVLHAAERPFTAILGGAKVSGKIEVINNILDKVDHLIIGGGMTFTFIRALGGKIGDSLVEDDLQQMALKAIEKAQKSGVKLWLPTDAVIADQFAADANTNEVKIDMIPDGWMGLDVGTQSIHDFSKVILESKTILWNGPVGVFEMDAFAKGTKAIAEAVAQATKNGSYSLVGGGDSVAALEKYDMKEAVSYVSTGGGAMLEYMEGKALPGIVAIKGE